MTDFRFIPVVPDPRLSSLIARISVFESGGRLPVEDRKLIVPNSNLKLTLTYRNGISAKVGNKTFIQKENRLTLTGLIDEPVNLDSYEDSETGTIIIEFLPQGAYRFFNLSFTDLRNEIVDLDDLTGTRFLFIAEQLADATGIAERIQILQNFLIGQLEFQEFDQIFDYCIQRILKSQGLVSVAGLEKETGYSARWLHRKFSEHLGTGPKNLSEIIRFKQFYQAYSSGVSQFTLKQHIYEYFYDQSHFLRAFRRFTGATPTELQKSSNELSIKNYII